jgi:ribosome-associated protein
MAEDFQKILSSISQTIFDKKGMNILALDVHKISTMTYFFLIAEGNVDRHVQAISYAIQDTMDQYGWSLLHLEGQQDGEWIVLDYGDIVIHLFTQEMREKYALEELWHDGKIIDVKIEVPAIPAKRGK